MATPSPYQRVGNASVTPSDYDYSVGTLYLRFNGVNQWMQTNSIDFTATDKMTVFAGVRKLSNSVYGLMIAELSVSAPANSGTFFIAYQGDGRPGFYSRGTGSAAYPAGSFAIPLITQVLSGIGDISGDKAILRVNGSQAAADTTTDQGTGNYGNYPLYIGARGGPSVLFNGRIYSLVVRGAQSTEQQIIDAEKYVNDKTRAYA